MSHCLKDSSRPLGTEGEGKRGKGKGEARGVGGLVLGVGTSSAASRQPIYRRHL